MLQAIIDEVKTIIEKSGNTFHCKVLKYLQDNGWTVLMSPYYNDNVSSKPREIDLIAEKAFTVNDRERKFRGTINVKLFMECKYISQKTVFWFHEKDRQNAADLVTRTTPLKIDNTNTNNHHYIDNIDHVAKLFADEGQKSTDDEIFYKALNQSLNSMVYFRNKESIIFLKDEVNMVGTAISTPKILYTVNYPVIVCNSFDNLYRVEIDTNAEPLNIAENFQLEVNYAFMTSNGINKNEYFLIDILSFDLFESFLNKIKVDEKLISNVLIRNL